MTFTFDLFTARSSLLPYAFVWEKPLKIFFPKTEHALWLNLCIYLWEQKSYQNCKNNDCTLTFDLFTVRSILLPYAFVWEKCSEFQTTSPLEPLGQFCSNFIWSLLRMGERKNAKMVAVRWPRWPPCPYMVKTFKNLLLQNRECLGAEPLQESSGTGGLPTLLKELSYVDFWPFYGKVKFASLCICMGKTFKNLLLQNRACFMAESLHISSGTGGLPKLLK